MVNEPINTILLKLRRLEKLIAPEANAQCQTSRKTGRSTHKICAQHPTSHKIDRSTLIINAQHQTSQKVA